MYQLALLFACLRQLPDAVQCTASALAICPNHLPTLYLFCLILTAQKSYVEAAQLADRIIAYDSASARQVSFVKAKIDRIIHGPQRAMLTLKQLLVAWRQHQSDLQASLANAPIELDDADNQSVASTPSMAASHITVSAMSGPTGSSAVVVGGGPANSIIDPGEAGAPSIHGSMAGVSRIESELTSTLFTSGIALNNNNTTPGFLNPEIIVTSPTGIEGNSQRNLPVS